MSIELIAFVILAVFGVTVLYKAIPYRNMGPKKPIVSVMPKYKTKVALPSSVSNSDHPAEELDKILSKYGFSKKSQKGKTSKYSRGHVLGDFSIKLAKINLHVTVADKTQAEISIEAGWVVSFDTGDFWKFMTELKQKIENET